MNSKHHSRAAIVRFALLAGALCGTAAHAQSARMLGHADVPFPFDVGRTAMPAGAYTFQITSAHIFVVHGDHKAAFSMVYAEPADHLQGNGRLVFHREDDGYHLQDLWSPTRQLHLRCVRLKHVAHRMDLAEGSGTGSGLEIVTLQ